MQVKTKAEKANHRARGVLALRPCATPSRTCPTDPEAVGTRSKQSNGGVEWVALGIKRGTLASHGRPGTLSPLALALSCEGRPGRISSSTMSHLARPVTTATTKTGGNERFDYAVSAMQGLRQNMEDAHAVVLDLDASTATSFFGVYDGHGGPAVSKYCAKHLHIELRKHEQFHDNPQAAIERTFLRMDEMLRDRSAGMELSDYGGNEYWRDYKKAIHKSRFLPICGQEPAYEGPLFDGCTACVVLIRGNQIIVGNAGDCRCVLSRNNQAIALSTDFKPDLPAERQRIEDSGHQVVTNGRGNVARIDDGIAVSRALGDLMYKDRADLSPLQQAITAFPEVRNEAITHDDQFLIIACDGIWDCVSSQGAVDFVRTYLNHNAGLDLICDALLGHCVAHTRGIDNMTVILVRFKPAGASQPSLPLPPPPPSVLPEAPPLERNTSTPSASNRGSGASADADAFAAAAATARESKAKSKSSEL